MLITEYMKKFIGISLFISVCLLSSCSSYDDERIWQDLNEIEKTLGDYEALTRTLTECPCGILFIFRRNVRLYAL